MTGFLMESPCYSSLHQRQHSNPPEPCSPAVRLQWRLQHVHPAAAGG